jgi:hypothetical protein
MTFLHVFLMLTKQINNHESYVYVDIEDKNHIFILL